jgi:hypothetical protein
MHVQVYGQDPATIGIKGSNLISLSSRIVRVPYFFLVNPMLLMTLIT